MSSESGKDRERSQGQPPRGPSSSKPSKKPEPAGAGKKPEPAGAGKKTEPKGAVNKPLKKSKNHPPQNDLSDSDAPSQDRADLTGQQLGKFAITKKIGSGGMGAVYLANDTLLDRMIALKILPDDKAVNPTLVKRFRAEAKSAALLNDDHIVKVYESGEIDGLYYISMEFIDGIDVSDLIKRKGKLSVKRTIDICKQIALALQHASEKNIVHRDIKPSNFLITRQGVVKLADMGLARAMDEAVETSITRAGSTVGTVDYMSPEQARNSKAADIRSDLYSLGCAWFHMLTGKPPFSEGSVTNKLQAHAVSPVPDLRQINPDVPMGIFAMIQRLMAKRPEDRYQTPEELLADLENSNILRSDIDEGGLDALASEVISERNAANRSGKLALPPKDKRPVKINDANGFFDSLVNMIPVIIVGGISLAIIGVMWWAISGFGKALEGTGNQAAFPATIEGDEVNQAGEVLRETTQPGMGEHPGNIAGFDDPSQPATPSSDINLQERISRPRNSNASPASSGLASTSIDPDDPLAKDIANIWKDLNQFPRISLASLPDFQPIDEQWSSLANALSGNNVIELTDAGPYMITQPVTINSEQFVLKSSQHNIRPTVIFKPNVNSSSQTLSAMSFPQGKILLSGIDFVIISDSQTAAIAELLGNSRLDFVDCSVTTQGTASQTTAIFLNSDELKPQAHLLHSAFRGDNLTAVTMQSNWGTLDIAHSLLACGNQPPLRLIDPKEPVTSFSTASTLSMSVQRQLTLRNSLLLTRLSAIEFDASGRITTSPPTQLKCDTCRFVKLPAHNSSQEQPSTWLNAVGLVVDNSPDKRNGVQTYFKLDLGHSTWQGYESLASLENQRGDQQRFSSIHDLENYWGSRWSQTQQSPAPADDSFNISLASLTNAHLQRTLASGDSADPLTNLTWDSFPFTDQTSWQATLLARSEINDDQIEEMFRKAEIIKVDLNRTRLQEVLNDAHLPRIAIIEVTGSGEIELPATLLSGKQIRLDCSKAPGLILKPQINKSTIAQRSDDKLPFESLLTIQDGLLELRQVTIMMGTEGTRSLQAPIWAVTSDRGHLVIDQSVLVGPTSNIDAHAGLIRELYSSTSAPTPEAFLQSPSIIQNSVLITGATCYQADLLPHKLLLHNSALITPGDGLSLNLNTPNGSSQSKIECSHVSFCCGQAAINITGRSATQTVSSVPMVISDCLFAPSLTAQTNLVIALPDLNTPPAPLSLWWIRNGISLGVGQLTATLPRRQPDAAQAWANIWPPGQESQTLLDADGVIFADPLPELKDFKLSNLTLDISAKAKTWGENATPIGASIDSLVKLTERLNQTTPGMQDVTPGGGQKIIRPKF